MVAPEIALLEEPTRDKQEEEESNIFSAAYFTYCTVVAFSKNVAAYIPVVCMKSK